MRVLAAALLFGPASWLSPALADTTAKYVILIQGDGMGPEHVRAGGMYVHGAAGTLSFESFPNQTTMTHNNASGGTTDSAASATAMATGTKVDNGVLSVRLPGDGSDLTSLLELHQARGRSSGLVTESFLTDASPAAHGAHETSRNNYTAIYGDYLDGSFPEVLLGGGGSGFDTTQAAARGYTVVTDRTALLGLDTEALARLAGSFGSGLIPPEGMAGRSASLPTLPEMTQQGLAVLDNDPDGFFAFFEQEGIDEYSHANDGLGLVLSMQELDAAVQAVIAWVDAPANGSDWNNTLVLVLADHETGGLTVTEINPQVGVVPAMTWSSTGHTQTAVPVYARGAGADQITGAQIDNTGIFTILHPAPATPTATATVSPTAFATASPTASPTASFTALATASPTASPMVLATASPTASPTAVHPGGQEGGRVQAFPIPGRVRINFSLQLQQGCAVRINIYNPAGERVAQLRESFAAGPALLTWDCHAAAAGVYLARVLCNGGEIETLKLYVAR